MLCKSCHYDLRNLSEPRCPECGLAFDPDDPNTFHVPQTRQEKLVIVVSAICVVVYLLFAALGGGW